ncbi:MAG: Fic family protein [Polyangiaceae bacterium]
MATTIEERTASLERRLECAPPHLQKQYRADLDRSWIRHDCALEGVVYSIQELRVAIGDFDASVPVDAVIQPVVADIRRHREALNFVRTYAADAQLPVNVDLIKRMYCALHPEEDDGKTVKFRRDVPQHRLYFHEYAPPDKIAYRLRQITDWVNDPETARTRNPLRVASRAHYDLLRVFPFSVDSGKVARMFMNLLLLRNGYPPAIIHSSERQRYYEALKGSSLAMLAIVQESIEDSLGSIERLLNQYEAIK